MGKKSLLIRLLALVVTLMCTLGASAYDFTYDGYYYKILTDSTAAITYKSGFNSYNGNVTIPEWVIYSGNTYTVTEITYFAFMNSTGLTSVTIPNTVTYIGSRAFDGCSALQTVEMGKNCSFYNPDAHGTDAQIFQNCPNLTSITCWMFEPHMWNEVSGYYCFDQSVLDNAKLYVPRGAEDNYQATEGWRLFAHIQEIPADYNYDYYYEGVFYKLKDDWGSVVATYMDEDFNTYSGTVTISQAVPYILWDETYYYTVTGIDDYAFRECNNLTSVSLPATIDSIGRYAFYNCTELTEIDIPNSVAYIGNGAFQGCRKLKSIMFPAGVTSINGSTCTGCSSLETIWFPVNLTDIYAGAFYYCNAITKIFSLNEEPPSMYNKNVFPSAVYDNATLYVPEDAVGYTSPYSDWKYFTTQKPYNQYLSNAINAPDGNITFSTPSTDNYPWLIKTDGDRIYAQSGNAGIHAVDSRLTTNVTVPNGGILSFDFKAWGERKYYSSIFDCCLFMIDELIQFRYGARDNDWETYTVELSPGDHILEWIYFKDGDTNPKGDYFALDNVQIVENLTVVGDVTGEGDVDIDDVNAIINIILKVKTQDDYPGNADITGEGEVDVDDMNAVINMILTQ